MDRHRRVDSCISILKEMWGNKTNELGSGQQELYSDCIRQLKKLAKQPRITNEELYRVVSEVAEKVFKIIG